jgi:hypothetical protein
MMEVEMIPVMICIKVAKVARVFVSSIVTVTRTACGVLMMILHRIMMVLHRIHDGTSQDHDDTSQDHDGTA